MFHKDEFMKYATKHLGMSSIHLEKYAEKSSLGTRTYKDLHRT